MNLNEQRILDRLTAHLDRGWELVARGDLQGALASAEQTLQIDAESPDAHNLLGYIYAARGETQLALDHYQQAVELDEYCIEAMLNAAELLIHPMAEFEQALRTLDDALEYCETPEEIVDATVLKIDALMHLSKHTDAKALVSTLPKGPFKNPHHAFLVGRAKFEMSDIEAAGPLLEQAANANDSHADARYFRGLWLEASGAHTEAVVAFLCTLDADARAPEPPWSRPRSKFESVVRKALQKLPEELAGEIEGALVVSSELPGHEIVAEGIDPRIPLMIDNYSGQSEGPVRLFIYRKNVERLVRQPLRYEDEIADLVETELKATLASANKAKDPTSKTPYSPRP